MMRNQKNLQNLINKFAGKITLGSELERSSITSTKSNSELRELFTLDKLIPGKVQNTPKGEYFHISRTLSQAIPTRTGLIDRYKRIILGPGQLLSPDSAGELIKIVETPPEKITFLDIESCGFSGSMIFLIGWCYFDGSDIAVTQLLARNYAEESAILHQTAQRLSATDLLITYNGKRFDLPMIRERALLSRVSVPTPTSHIDLLDHTRLFWKYDLPNCQLQTIELLICNYKRENDISGSMIAQVYHEYVKTGFARKLQLIIHHNLLDLITLVEITTHLLAGT